MRVIVDIDEAGNVHWINPVADPNHLVQHPADGRLVTVDVMLQHHNENYVDRLKGGWEIMSQLPGEPQAMTRWQRLVKACNHSDAHPAARALGLKD